MMKPTFMAAARPRRARTTDAPSIPPNPPSGGTVVEASCELATVRERVRGGSRQGPVNHSPSIFLPE